MPIPIAQGTYSGNVNDSALLHQYACNEIDVLLKQFPNLKHISVDSAGAKAPFINALHAKGIYIVTKLTRSHSITKRVMADVEGGKLKFSQLNLSHDESTPDAPIILSAYAGKYEIKDKKVGSCKVSAFYVQAENMRDSKLKSVRAKAESQQNKAQRLVRSNLYTHPRTCKDDALKELQEIMKSAPLCKYEIKSEQFVKHYEGKGKPGKNSTPKSVSYVMDVEVSVDECKVDQQILNEIQYVLITSDPKPTNAKEIYMDYHAQSDIEVCWRDLKLTGQFL